MFSEASKNSFKKHSQRLLFSLISGIVTYSIYICKIYFEEHFILYYIAIGTAGLISITAFLITTGLLIWDGFPEVINLIRWILSCLFTLQIKPYKSHATIESKMKEENQQNRTKKKQQHEDCLASLTKHEKDIYDYAKKCGYNQGYQDGFDDGRRRGERFPREWAH